MPAGYSPAEAADPWSVSSRVTATWSGNCTRGERLPTEHDVAALAGQRDGELDGPLEADRFEDDARSVVGGELPDPRGGFLGVMHQGQGGTQRLGALEAARVDVDGDDRADPACAQGAHDDEPDEAGPHHDDRPVDGVARAGDGVQGDRERLDHRPLHEADAVRQPMEDVGGDRDELGEGSGLAILLAGHPEHPASIAEVDLAAAAIGARAAEDRRIEGDAVIPGPPLDLGSHLPDDPGGLMAHDDGRDATTRATVHPVDVAAADAAGADLDEHLARSDLGVRHDAVDELVRGGQGQRLHASLRLSGVNVRRPS